MPSPILIRGGTIITAEASFRADLRIEGETIAAIGPNLLSDEAEVVEADGKLLLPGGVDVHTHFDLPMFGTVSSDDHYTGHKAAAFGGTTTVIDFVPQPERSGLRAGVQSWHAKADGKAAIDFGFHMNITRFDPQVAAEIPHLIDEGIPSLKVFSAYNNRLRLQDGEIFQVLRIAARHGMLTMLHAENGDVIDLLVGEALAAGHTSPEWHARTRPAWGAVEAALRGIALAAQAGAPLYLVHMNTAGEVDQLRYGRARGVTVMGETCPPYLFFTLDHLRRPDGAKWVCSPPMRQAEDNAALWEALADGTLQTVGTDHCPFFFDGTRPIEYEGRPVAIPGKELGAADFTKIPNGLPGVGDRLPVMWTHAVVSGRIHPSRFVALTSTNPARIFGLYPRKGVLQPGADADVVVWDPSRRVTYGLAYAQHRTDYNLYEGWELEGFPEIVFLRGQRIVDHGRWLGRPGMGRFLHRRAGAEVL
ncbi:MAG: dihydropyrimidinase [Chloroflexi bacterium RBG_13_68_17]|nr:MAG: dihydropyrimidinase [Chloroflexi bacterium RBG_13_68_17]